MQPATGSRSRGRPPNPELRTAKHARMLKAAMDLFVDRGYEHVTVEEIARAAGQSKGAFYWYFKDKEDCLQQIVRAWAQKMDAAMTQAMAERNTRAKDRIFAISDFRNWCERDFQRFVMLLNGLSHSRSGTVRDMALKLGREWTRNGLSMIKQLANEAAREAGWTQQQLAAFDFDAWAFVYICSFSGVYRALEYDLSGAPLSPERIAGAIHQFFIAPVTARQADGQQQQTAR